MINIKEYLREKEICEKILSNFKNIDVFTHLELKIIAVMTVLLSFGGYFSTSFAKDSGYPFLAVLSVSSMAVSLFLGGLFIYAFISKASRIIPSTNQYLLDILGEADYNRAFDLFSKKEIENFNDSTKCVKEKLENLESKFLEKEVIEEFHDYLLRNEKDVEKYLSYFTECLEQYNRIHNWKANNVIKANAELSAAGLASLPVKDESLVLKIEESE